MVADQRPDTSMRMEFRGYYRISPARTRAIWKSALVVFDTNVLLDLYRYSRSTRDELLDVMTRLEQQLWLPHQVAKEYQERRLNVVRQQDDVARNVRDAVKQARKNLTNRCNDLAEHPYLERASIEKAIEDGFDLIEAELEKPARKSDPWDPLEDDEIRTKLDALYDGRVGPAFSPDEMKDVVKEGERRFAEGIPPGFADSEKDGDRKYGDMILWLQVVAKAADVEKPVILVTNDQKEDWWWMHGSSRIAPHPALVEELFIRAGTELLMYMPGRFTEQAGRTLKRQVSKTAIDEIETVADRPADVSKDLWGSHRDVVNLPSSVVIDAAEDLILRVRQRMNGHIGQRAALNKQLAGPLTAEELNELSRAISVQHQHVRRLEREIHRLEEGVAILREGPGEGPLIQGTKNLLVDAILGSERSAVSQLGVSRIGWRRARIEGDPTLGVFGGQDADS